MYTWYCTYSKALAILDRWASLLKTALTKIFLESRNTEWSNEWDTIVNKCNITPHETLDDHTHEVLKDEAVRIEVMHANMYKNKKTHYYNPKGVIYQCVMMWDCAELPISRKAANQGGERKCTLLKRQRECHLLWVMNDMINYFRWAGNTKGMP